VHLDAKRGGVMLDIRPYVPSVLDVIAAISAAMLLLLNAWGDRDSILLTGMLIVVMAIYLVPQPFRQLAAMIAAFVAAVAAFAACLILLL
jgi:hypothetical protein